VVQIDLQGRSLEETAEVLGISLSAAKRTTVSRQEGPSQVGHQAGGPAPICRQVKCLAPETPGGGGLPSTVSPLEQSSQGSLARKPKL
jgi:hypothetical protein